MGPAIAARLVDGRIEIAAPRGTTDLFELRVRPTPHFAANQRELLSVPRLSKNWIERWPRLVIDLA